MMKKLYCFDFDGTITTKDTMFLFLKFYHPRRYYFQFLRHAPLFVMVKLNLINTEKVKRSFIASVLKNERKSKLDEYAEKFYQHYHTSLIRKSAKVFFDSLDKEATVYLVTASLDIWVKVFAENLKVNYIATKAKFENGIFTGKFETKNCNGPEKVNRILQTIEVSQFDKTIAFGDTYGDKQMLEWADESYFRFFH